MSRRPSPTIIQNRAALRNSRHAASWLCALLVLIVGGCGPANANPSDADAGPGNPPPANSAAPPSAARNEDQQPPALIRVAQAVRKEVRPRVVVVGTVLPRWMSVVASGAEGLVEDFKVESGDFVAQGDVLSVLRMESTDLELAEAKAVLREREQDYLELKNGSRPEDIAEAKARLLAAEATRKNAAAKLDRAKELFAQKAINQHDLDDAQERADAAEQLYLAAKAVSERTDAGPRSEEIEQARARFEAQEEHVAYLESEKAKRTTTAPFDGYVTEVQTFVGQWLSKGDPVVTLSMLDIVDVFANVDQSDLQHVRLGETVEVRVAGSGQPSWPGQIARIISRSDWQSGSRSFPVKVRIQNSRIEVDGKPQPVLREGMMAEVTFTGDPVETLLVPKDSLVRGSRGVILFVFQPDQRNSKRGSVRQLAVQPGLSEGNLIEVAAEDLAPGMLVVTEGAERLRPFQSAMIVPEEQSEERQPPAGRRE